jgi:ATP-binding cassette subfamily B multidrug efflux pump
MSTLKLALAPDDVEKHKQLDHHLFARLWKYLQPYSRWVYLTLVMSLASGGLRVLQPLFAKRIIDVEIAGHDLHGLFVMSMVLLGIVLVQVLIDILFTFTSTWIGQHGMHDLRRGLFERVLSQDINFFDRTPIGRLITRLTSDVGTLNELFSSGVVTILSDFMVIIGVLVIMFFHNVTLTCIVLLSAPVILVVVMLFRNHSRRWYLETRRRLATMNTYLQENVTGMRTVQMFNRESANRHAFNDLNGEYRDANINTINVFALFFPAIALLGMLVVGFVTWVGGRQIISGRGTGVPDMTYGELFLFIQCVNMLFHPIRALSEKYNLLQSAMASSERIFKLLDSDPSIASPPDAETVVEIRQAIRFKDVHFSYLPNEPVLKGVSFDIPRGHNVAVVGATGAGKSTLINLLTRFYDVDSGRIEIDGQDLRRIDIKSLRRLYAVVLQDVFLFSGTIAENIRFSSPGLTDEYIWKILREVNMAGFVGSLEGGLQAQVSERGDTFSTGQKQLLAFARALAADPQVLVLDEATSNIDTETEQLIQHATQRILKDRTALVIAHRLSTIQRADHILVMHHGHIHESGTHQELLERDGIYQRLYEMQYRQEPVNI